MKLSVVSGAPDARTADVLVYPGFLAEPGKKKHKGFGGHLADVDEALGGLLVDTAAKEGFTGAAGQIFSMHTHGRVAASRVFLVGMGPADKLTVDAFRKLAAHAVKQAEKVKGKRAIVVVPEAGEVRQEARIEACAEGALLAAYRFDKYISKDKTPATLEELELAVSGRGRHDDAIARAQAVAAGVVLARDLVNEPAGILTPVEFAKRAQDAAKKHGLKITVLDEKDIEKERMGLVLAVAAAARPYHPPRVVKLEYRPSGKKKKAKKHIALVGKGLTFDSGGLDIKPADGMLDMKVDMSGAAAVLGAMIAIAEIKPKVAVTGYLGCVENGIGGNAYHPGDVIISRKGLSVEINNTDAEGRLVLADCIDFAITEDEPDVLIDLATLTGACMVALGPHTAGVFSDDDELAEDIRTIGKRAGEDFWRLPLNDMLLEQLKSNIADMKNTGIRWGGAITAALFLKQFVDGRVTWAHLDIAGPADTDRDWDYVQKGGVGFGVRTLVGLIDPH